MYSSLTLLQLQQDSAVVGIATEVASALVVPEHHILPQLQLLGPLHPLRLQRGLIQVQQATNDEGVVVQKARDRRGSAEYRGRRGMRIRAAGELGHFHYEFIDGDK